MNAIQVLTMTLTNMVQILYCVDDNCNWPQYIILGKCWKEEKTVWADAGWACRNSSGNWTGGEQGELRRSEGPLSATPHPPPIKPL